LVLSFIPVHSFPDFVHQPSPLGGIVSCCWAFTNEKVPNKNETNTTINHKDFIKLFINFEIRYKIPTYSILQNIKKSKKIGLFSIIFHKYTKIPHLE
jgi:hypothetical protein